MDIIILILICVGLLAFGIINFIYLFKNRKYRSSEAIEHYTEMRDDITLAKEKIVKKKVSRSSASGSLISGVISLVIIAIVFAQVLLPTITTISQTMNTSVSLQNSEYSEFIDNSFNILPIVGFIFLVLVIFGFKV